MEDKVDFVINQADGSESFFTAYIKKDGHKLDITLTTDTGVREFFEIIKEDSEIIVNTLSMSIRLQSHTPLYKKLLEIGEVYFQPL
ncbi:MULTISPECIES: hypothetical protein [unclassified Sphingobacterium]|uniref:hypothetical protein n=1 Tax=unclassified Sphingobacterium TaxID=2609468 RepID=UPI0020C27CD3|nr:MULTISPECIES: hypothetical protein [unclassified Sphingobacterium]